MEPESSVVSRPTVSIVGACTALNVPRSTIYDYISSGAIEYVRTAGGSVRIFVDSLADAGRRRNEQLRQERRARIEEQRALNAPQHAPRRMAEAPPRESRLPELPLFRWSGPAQLVRNSGRPAYGQSCPCCGSTVACENLYDGSEPEYESEETLYCLLCGWACHYQCKPLTRGVASQFYIVTTLCSFTAASPRIDEFKRRLAASDRALPLERRAELAAAKVFRTSSVVTILRPEAPNALFLAARVGKERVGLYCRRAARGRDVGIAAVSLLRALQIDWKAGELRLNMRGREVSDGVLRSFAGHMDLTSTLSDGRQLLELIGACSRTQPRLEVLTPVHRAEIVAARRANSDRYRRGLELHRLFDAEEG